MKTDLNTQTWMNELISKLQETFADRVVLVGLQGSRARNEARDESDIDAVVIIESFDVEDMRLYREIIESMPHHELACGFIGSRDVLAAWPRYDVFNLVQDTHIYFGSFSFMDTEFTQEDAIKAAQATASEIYHALAHTIVFEEHSLQPVLDACVKSSFFAMRALRFASTGIYPSSRSEMRTVASSEEALFLDAYDDVSSLNPAELASKLFAWVEKIISIEDTRYSNQHPFSILCRYPTCKTPIKSVCARSIN